MALVACIALAVFFLTDPLDDKYYDPITVTYNSGEGETIIVNDYSSETILSLLNEEKWRKKNIESEWDFVLDFNGKLLKYNSDSGVFYNEEKSKALFLEENDKNSVNRLLWALVLSNQDRLSWLKENIPKYFGLDASEGLTVYVGELARGAYGCKLVSNADKDALKAELLTLSSVSIEDMKLILSTYDIFQVSVKHYQPMHSSYLCFDTESCEKKVHSMLLEFP